LPGVAKHVIRIAFRCYPFRRGHGRLVDRTFIGKLRFKEDRLEVATRDGFRMRVIPNDLIGRHLFYTGQYERTIADVLTAFARPDDRILDIGANMGYVSAVLLKRLAQARVLAIEPQPDICDLLRSNLESVGGGRA
jgi:spermidine synthase